METKNIVSVSEITITAIPNIGYSYGFTIQFAGGEIRNILSQSAFENDPELLKKLSSERRKYIKQQALKEQER